MENPITDAEYIRQEIDSGRDVLVQKIDEYQIMIGVGYGLTDTGLLLVVDRDTLRCEWEDSNGFKNREVIPIVQLVRAA